MDVNDIESLETEIRRHELQRRVYSTLGNGLYAAWARVQADYYRRLLEVARFRRTRAPTATASLASTVTQYDSVDAQGDSDSDEYHTARSEDYHTSREE